MVSFQANSMSQTRILPKCSVQVVGAPSLKTRSAVSIPNLPNDRLLKELELNMSSNTMLKKFKRKEILQESPQNKHFNFAIKQKMIDDNTTTLSTRKLYTVLEAVLDRIEMHQNVGEQRENWNSLLLNSLNMVTLTASTMAALAGLGDAVLPLKISSFLLFSAATGILLIMNKIQPAQLVEEQRNSVRLFKQLRTQIQTKLSLETTVEEDVEDAMERVLALDRAYPLPLLGSMLNKFPQTFEPATWWPKKNSSSRKVQLNSKDKMSNGWSKELEDEMLEIVGVIKRKDIEDYYRLGNKALKLNKMLATAGPLLTGTAALGSAFLGQGSPCVGILVALAGSLASVVNTVEHGGQVGMVFEMYRNCAGFFSLLEETIESNIEQDVEKRDNGELFEMKVALKLGRSLSELRDVAYRSSISWLSDEENHEGEFASKMF